MAAASERHNAISRDVLLRVGGTTSEVMVILESVVAGVLTACAVLDDHDAQQRDSMLMALEDGVRGRLADIPIKRR
jgi:hypothetical protein